MRPGGTDTVIGVIEREETDTRITESVRNTATETVVGSAAEVLDAGAELVIAHGEPAVLAVGRTGTTVPVLPIDAGPSRRSVSIEQFERALDAVVSEQYDTVGQCRYEIVVDGDPVGTAVADAMLITEEPARISEYSIRADGHRVAQFRADGVVIATPAGSHGYAAAARGPMLAPGTGVVAVPIAQFATDRDSWVLGQHEPITLRVERDDGPVELLVDDRRRRIVKPGVDVTLSPTDPLSLAITSESQPYWSEHREHVSKRVDRRE